MDDLISRQYVIGLIRSMYPSPPILPSNKRKWAEKYEQFIRAEREISRLPSVQPSEEYEKGWKDGQEALREEMWEYERDRLDQQTGCDPNRRTRTDTRISVAI